MTLYNNKYRIETCRLQGYDYSQNGYYFVTICTYDRIFYFGNVINGSMILNENGKTAMNVWLETPEIRKNVFLDEWIIMPNHVHMIVIINNDNVETHCHASLKNGKNNIKTHCNASLRNNEYKNKFGPQLDNLSAIIRGFKGRVKKLININNSGKMKFNWQERFYDRIIRNDYELDNVRNYILNNPIKWYRDRNNKEGLYM